MPQCNTIGGWEPVQCHPGTGKGTLGGQMNRGKIPISGRQVVQIIDPL